MIYRTEYMQRLKAFKDNKIIKVVTGLRRSGKSTLLEMFRNELLEDGVRLEQIQYLNFELMKYDAIRTYKQLYDLVIEKDGKLAKVQVKATGCKTKNNIYQLSLKSCGGTKGKEYKTLINTNIDYLFILNADLKMYVIPKNEIKNKSTINLGEKMNKFIVEF